MTHIAQTALCLFALTLGCASDDVVDSEPYPATVTDDSVVQAYQSCDATTPCPDGLDCIALRLSGGDTQVVCINAQEACDLVDCGGECMFAESYPPQLFCDSGSGDTSDDDHDCDDDSVSGGGGSSEPGNVGAEETDSR